MIIVETKSIWKVNTQEKVLPKLNQDISCDILIVGGGIAGLSCAYYLKDTNRKIVLIDKNTCGSGATGYNTGKLTWMQDLIYHKIEKNYDTKTALLYLESQKEAIKLINDIVKDNHIDCNLTKTKAYVFTDQEKNYEKFNKEIKFYQENNIKYKINNQLPITYPSKLVIETDDNSFVFNPYKYLIELKEKVKNNIKIYEKTRCVSIDTKDGYYLARTLDNYVIKSKIIIVTTHYPIFIVPYFIPFKTEVKKFFLVAGEVKSKKDVQILSNGNPSISMRYYSDKENNYFIYGRNSHSTTKKLDIRDDYRTITEEYKTFFKKEANFFFHTHDLMTYDDMPLIGEVKPNLYIATGFNKWGNTNGTISGKIISDLIIKKENKYCEIFSPKRGLSLDKIKNIPLFNFNIGIRYIRNKLNSKMKYYDNKVIIKNINGQRCGIYIDEKNKSHIVSNICPHMKCNLVFNYIDKTWDCPCHSSRFDIDGNVIYGPSVYDIKIQD